MTRVHILGIAGTLMGAFAALLKRQGIHVTGSDEAIYPPMSEILEKAQVPVFLGYSSENLDRLSTPPDVVVIGNVIRADNPEVKAVMEKKWKYVSLPQFMEENLLTDTWNIVIAGTHGKTTTTSWMSHVLNRLQQNPSYFVGGVCRDLSESFHVSNQVGGYFVLEGDEYDTAFWDKVPKFTHYRPKDIVLTSIEFDHADIYKDLGDVMRVFRELVASPARDGILIACTDYRNVCAILPESSRPVYGYGLKERPQDVSMQFYYRAKNVQSVEQGTRFEIEKNGQTVDHVTIPFHGDHNVLNALAVWIETERLGLAPEAVKSALSSFQGVRRRQEVRGEPNGVTVIDDFAHHPTAVQLTLNGLKKKYPEKRLLAVFEPRSATSRRKIFQEDFARALLEADFAFVSVPYDQSRIPENERLSSDEMIAAMNRKDERGRLFYHVEEGVEAVAAFAKPGDVIAVLSNGGFGGFIPKLLARMSHGG